MNAILSKIPESVPQVVAIAAMAGGIGVLAGRAAIVVNPLHAAAFAVGLIVAAKIAKVVVDYLFPDYEVVIKTKMIAKDETTTQTQVRNRVFHLLLTSAPIAGVIAAGVITLQAAVPLYAISELSNRIYSFLTMKNPMAQDLSR